jgi:hypothetical protein
MSIQEQCLMENAKIQPRRRSALQIGTTIARWLMCISGPTAFVLGVLFWTGNALTLIPVHMLAGIVLILALWTLAIPIIPLVRVAKCVRAYSSRSHACVSLSS